MQVLLDTNILISAASFRIIKTPDDEVEDEKKIRDVKDRPLLRAAQIENIDILLTGDQDFLEASVEIPMILNPVQFLKMENNPQPL